MTRSPTACSLTPGPMALTTPAASMPGTNGGSSLTWYLPEIVSRSGKFSVSGFNINNKLSPLPLQVPVVPAPPDRQYHQNRLHTNAFI